MNSEKQSTNLQMTLREVNRVGEGQKNVPKLRFKGYEDAWEQRKLGEIVLSEIKGSAKAEMIGGDTPYLETNYLNGGECLFVDSENNVDTDDVIVLWDGSQAGTVYHGFSGALGSTFKAYKTKCLGLFIFQQLKKNQQTIYDKYRTPNIPHVIKTFKDEYDVMLTSEEEQNEIGRYFQQIDHLITLHQRKYDALKSMKKTLLSKMFPKNGEDVPEIRFKEFTDAWEQRKLGTAIDVKSGKDYKHLDEGDVPVYGTGGYMLSVSEALENTRDAIGIGRKGTIDKPFVLKAPFWTVDTLFYCIPKENNSLSFLYSLFQSINWKLYDESTGVPSLSKTAIDGVTIKLTSEDEQSSIGECFESVDNLITLHQRKLEELKNMKKTLLQQMFV